MPFCTVPSSPGQDFRIQARLISIQTPKALHHNVQAHTHTHSHSLFSPLTLPQPLHAFILQELLILLHSSLAPVFPQFSKSVLNPSLAQSSLLSTSHVVIMVPFSKQVSLMIFAASFTATQSDWEPASPFNHYSISVSPEPQGVSQSHVPCRRKEMTPFQNLSAGSKGSHTDLMQFEFPNFIPKNKSPGGCFTHRSLRSCPCEGS